MNKVVITGLGCVSPLGFDVDSFSSALFSSNPLCGIQNISLFESPKVRTKIAAEVKNYNADNYFSRTELKQLDRYSQFALLATEEAINQAGLSDINNFGLRAACIYGTGVGGQITTEQSYQQLYEKDKSSVHPFTIPKLIPSAAASHISTKYKIKGPCFATTSACASAGHAIATAVMMIRSNIVDIAIVGGAEACITEGNFLAWESLRVLSNDTCRPFSNNRSGLVIGEGAGTLVLESSQHAKARGAAPLAELAGIGMSSDAHNLVQPDASGAAAAMKACLGDGKFSPADIQYINAHGSATKQNDVTETKAIHEAFGSHANKLAISSTKSQHGHMLGAGAAIETIASILALSQQTLPCTLNYSEQDPVCDLDYVVNKVRPAKISVALSNSFAFGGLNTCLALTQA